MKLTPLDIRHKDFKRGMRGYVDTEVDEFLDDVADEFERLFKENIDFGERVEAVEEKLAHYRMIEDTLQKTLLSAQQSADELKQNATKESQLILRDAELKARQMLNESYADKQRIEKEIALLRNTGDEFRFRFRSMLESYVGQVGELDRGAQHNVSDFQRQAEALKEAIAREDTAPPAKRDDTATKRDSASQAALREALVKLVPELSADSAKPEAAPPATPAPASDAEPARNASGQAQRVPVEWHVTSGEAEERAPAEPPEPPERARFTIDDVLADHDIDGDDSK